MLVTVMPFAPQSLTAAADEAPATTPAVATHGTATTPATRQRTRWRTDRTTGPPELRRPRVPTVPRSVAWSQHIPIVRSRDATMASAGHSLTGDHGRYRHGE